MNLKLFIPLVFIVVCGQTHAQDQWGNGIVRYTTERGLASNVVYGLAQDSIGYMWICTREGLCRFGGNSFDCFGRESGLENIEILAVEVDKFDRKWLSAFNQEPAYFQNGKLVAYKESIDPTDRKNVYSYGQDEDFLYLKAKKEIYQIDPKTLEIINSRPETPGEFRLKRATTKKGFYKGKLLVLNFGNTPSLYLLDTLTMDTLFMDGEFQTILSQIIITNHAYSYLDQHIIIGTNSGLTILTEEENGIFGFKTLLEGLVIHDIFFDRENNVWLSTRGDGLLFIEASHFKSLLKFPSQSGGLKIKASAMCVNRNFAFFLTPSYEIYAYSTFENKMESYSEKLGIPLSISIDLFGVSLYILTSKKLLVYNLTTEKLSIHCELPVDSLATTPKRFTRIDDNISLIYTNKVLVYKGGLLTNRITLMNSPRIYAEEKINDSLVWIGTTKGLFSFNPHTDEVAIRVDTSLNAWVNDICVQASGDVVVATQSDGLRFYSQAKSNQFALDTILFQNFSTSHISNSRNSMLVSSSNGIFKINNKNHQIESRYNASNGLSANEIYCSIRAGPKFLVGTYSGVDIIDANDRPNYTIPTMDIQKILVNNKPYTSISGLRLPHDSNTIQIDYSAIDFVDNNLTYEYQLEGHDPNSLSSVNQNVHYSNLPAGKYTFSIAVKSSTGQYSKPVKFNFSIQAAWWRSFQFYILCSIIGALILAILWWDQKRRSTIQLKLAQLRLSALHAQINPHFLFNGLQSLQSYINENATEKANAYLVSFASFVRKTLETSKTDFVLIKDEVKYLDAYLKLECEKRNDEFTYNIKTDSSITSNHFIPSMVVQPFVENALIHGLVQKTYQQKLSIVFSKKDANSIECVIVDNGKGLIQALKNKTKRHESYASNATMQKIDLLHKIHRRKGLNTKKYVEIFDNSKEPSSIFQTGTTVKLLLPIKSNHA